MFNVYIKIALLYFPEGRHQPVQRFMDELIYIDRINYYNRQRQQRKHNKPDPEILQRFKNGLFRHILVQHGIKISGSLICDQELAPVNCYYFCIFGYCTGIIKYILSYFLMKHIIIAGCNNITAAEIVQRGTLVGIACHCLQRSFQFIPRQLGRNNEYRIPAGYIRRRIRDDQVHGIVRIYD